MKSRITPQQVIPKLGSAIICGWCLISTCAAAEDTNRFARVGIDQKLDAQIPLALNFRDEAGGAVQLKDYFGAKPVVLVLAYYECPNLCTLVLNGLLASAQDLKLSVGKDFEIVVVSINPHETPALAAEKKQTYTLRYGREGGACGWHFLTGDESAIERLADNVGFRYAFDADSKQYAHSSAIMVLTPRGKISRYFAGIEFPPREFRLALVEASDQHIGSVTDQAFLFCFHYNPVTGRYGLAITRIVRITCFATILALGSFVVVQLRNERRPVPNKTAGHVFSR